MQKLYETANSQKLGHLYKFKKHAQTEFLGQRRRRISGKRGYIVTILYFSLPPTFTLAVANFCNSNL
jgi:hypothetical protein